MGAPYFNRFVIPVGLALLFLMAVAPALPWRKTTVEVMRGRLAVPAALGVAHGGGLRPRPASTGIEPLLAFGLGAFAAASAGRALVLSVRGAYRAARACGRLAGSGRLAGGAGFVGRANGGMVVHIGVVVVAIGLAAATAFGHRGSSSGEGPVRHLRRAHGRVRRHPDGHARRRTSAFEARAAGRRWGVFTPAISQFGSRHPGRGHAGHRLAVGGTTLPDHRHHPGQRWTWTFGVVEQPLVMWLWIGAALVGVGFGAVGRSRTPAPSHRSGVRAGRWPPLRPRPPTTPRWPGPATAPDGGPTRCRSARARPP